MSVQCKALTQKGTYCTRLAMTTAYPERRSYPRRPMHRQREYCWDHIWLERFEKEAPLYEKHTGRKVTIS